MNINYQILILNEGNSMVKNDFNSLKKYIEVALILVGISIIPIFIYTVIKEYPILLLKIRYCET